MLANSPSYEHLRVDLVGEHPCVGLGDQRGGARDVLRRQRSTRRVLGRVEDDELRPRPEPLCEILGREREVALLEKRQRNRGRPHPADRRLVDREAGIGIDDLVSRVAGGEDAEEEERLRTGSDENVLRADVDSAGLREVLRGRLAQLRDPRGRAVVRLAGAQRLRCDVADVERRREVRLADLEVDDVAALPFERLRSREDAERRLRAEPLQAGRHAPSRGGAHCSEPNL